MKILVTGGAGFIGSHIVDAYVKAGHRVTVLDDLSSGKRANLNSRARFVKADLAAPSVEALFRRGKFDVVNHHAGQIDVRRSVADPLRDAKVNVLGLLSVLERCRRHGVKKLIFAASGGSYYGECPRPARESDPPAPVSPYGVAKLAGEHYLRAYRAMHGLHYTVLRYANVYGPRQDLRGEAGVISIFCERLLSGKAIPIFGDGRQQRDYVFVGDVARANLLALRRAGDQSLNIGTGRATSVNQLRGLLGKVSGLPASPVFQAARPGELVRSCLNASRAAASLGWRPAWTLERGLRETFQSVRAGSAR